MVSVERIADEFARRFEFPATHVAIAPGRVNLIGEHTDYHEGFVFPAAIDRHVSVAIARIEGPSRLRTISRSDEAKFDARAVEQGDVSGWLRYPAGVCWALREFVEIPNFAAFVWGDLPTGSGLSSSAAVELAFAAGLQAVAGSALAPIELALAAKRAENDFVGVPCGIMDQLASACGVAGHALFLDCRTLDAVPVPIPSELELVVCDTGVRHKLADGQYAARRAESERAAELIGVSMLRDCTMEMLEAARPTMDDALYRRAKHVVTEDARTQEFAVALRDCDLNRIGRLMGDSHDSLRLDYEVSCPELDAMVLAAKGAPGFVGARMTGGGFGGSCVALVEAQSANEFRSWTEAEYRAATGRTGVLLRCRAADGARVAAVAR